MTQKLLLDIKDLQVSYKTDSYLEQIGVVRGIDLNIQKGECVGLVGESGCGKSSVGLSITKLIPERKANISGRILFEDNNILNLGSEELRNIRGKRISYVFQEAFSSLNPLFTVYEQIKEVLTDKENIENSIAQILKNVGLQEIINRKKVYPHHLSGGMQQRVVIAMAIAAKPDLLILDEPTTALDVTIQKQILDLIIDLKRKFEVSILFISHDLRTIFRLTDRINIMYAGKIVEEGPKDKIISNPLHPYTMGLINSIPSFGHRKEKFNAIEGRAPSFSDLPNGCKFHPRCKFKIDKCEEKEPELEGFLSGRFSRCIRVKELFY